MIDDDAVFATDLILLLRESYRVVHAASLEGVDEFITTQKPDLILSDVHLGPEESGFDLLSRLSKNGVGIPVLMMSDSPSIKLVVKAMNLGAEGFITKSTDTKELLNAIDEVFQKQKARKQNF